MLAHATTSAPNSSGMNRIKHQPGHRGATRDSTFRPDIRAKALQSALRSQKKEARGWRSLAKRSGGDARDAGGGGILSAFGLPSRLVSVFFAPSLAPSLSLDASTRRSEWINKGRGVVTVFEAVERLALHQLVHLQTPAGATGARRFWSGLLKLLRRAHPLLTSLARPGGVLTPTLLPCSS